MALRNPSSETNSSNLSKIPSPYDNTFQELDDSCSVFSDLSTFVWEIDSAEIVPESELTDMDSQPENMRFDESETVCPIGSESVVLATPFSDSEMLPSIPNWYDNEEARSEFLQMLRVFVPSVSKFICDVGDEFVVPDTQFSDSEIPPCSPNMYASGEARIEYLQMLGMFVPSVLKLI